MTPLQYLILVSGILALSLFIASFVAFLRSRRLATVAKSAGFQFSRPDRFDLSRRVALRLPVFGAAEVNVRDILYATTPQGLLCVMTASFTLGTVGHRRQFLRVCSALDLAGKDLKHFSMLPSPPTPTTYTQALTELQSKLPAPPAGT